MFPDVAQKIYIINAPSLFASAYNLVKPVIGEKTRQKIQILNSNYREHLCDELGAEHLYSHWGGTKVAIRGSKTTGKFLDRVFLITSVSVVLSRLFSGGLRMGGIPPEHLRYIPLNNSEHIDDLLLTKVNVPARSKRQIEVECKQDGQLLRWFFHSSSDIEFSVFYKEEKEMRLVVPKFRLHTDYVPEVNSFCNFNL